jgi:predicted AAA+ superfamily ATPase
MIRRYITGLVAQSLQKFPSVLLNGARQVGKSTLALQLQKEGLIKEYVTLDDLSILEIARRNPEGFIAQFKDSVAIDEIQRAPDLLIAIKRAIDTDRKPGRFLLTGSANLLSWPKVTESLAGRMDIITLEGLSIGEVLKQPTPSSFVKDLFSGLSTADLLQKWKEDLKAKPSLARAQVWDSIFFGGFPEIALVKDPDFTTRWFSSYLSAYIERDVRDLNRFLDVVSFSKLFRLAGVQSGNLLNYNTLGVEAGLDQRTVARYIEILEITFQLNQLRPWFSNTHKRLVKTPKVYMNDTGQMSYLLGLMNSDEAQNHPQYVGSLVETWLWAELRKLIHISSGIESFFYRTHIGKEVDFVLKRGEIFWGIECKATETLTHKHFNNLEDMQEVLGPKSRGIILHMGDKILPFSDGLIGIPFRLLI